MAGEIEDDEPEESGIHLTSVRSIDFSLRRPKVDVEEFVDRLKFMGVNRELVEEAERRLTANARRGMRWVEERLRELEPPRSAPRCGECGEELVDTDWRGRATVRCSACGSRWGIEVVDAETESLWAISGPSEEWRAAHPLEEHDPYGDFAPEEVLRTGLPPLPSGDIEPGTYFPVAMWQGSRDAAVLYVHRRTADECDGFGDEYEDETEHLVRDDEGEWMSVGSGGGSWVNVFDPPTDLLEKYVVLGTGTSGSGDDEAVYFTGGLCSGEVAAIETTDRAGARRYKIDPSRPFFVVGIYGRGRVRIVDAEGDTVRGFRQQPLEFDVGD
ncbi:MAG: hypothetical protein KY439_03815 [Actinobacteria bacterium]|nr:hypothetical protein [Actinomycetota bacterium]